MEAPPPRPRSPRSREAVRVAGSTWRHTRSSPGDRCHSCGRCDSGAPDHGLHLCSLSPAWFAGTLTVCSPCFAQLVRDELEIVDIELVGIPERIEKGDVTALDELRRLLEDDPG